MKRTLLLSIFFLMVAVQSAMAYQETSRLQIRSFDNAPIVVVMDGIKYGPFSNRHKLTNLAGGIHRMQVIAQYSSPYRMFPMTQTIYDGQVNVDCGFLTDLVINRGAYQVVDQVALYGYQPVVTGPIVCGTKPAPVPVQPIGPQPMCDAAFNDLMQVISSKSFESTKLTIARQVIAQNYFTSFQVKQLMCLFTFESSRLEIAKFAYPYVLDQNRYFVVNDAFTFESSIYELNQFLYS
ncbi:MAG: DUF4476 domain-containing protein [Chitinophagales bacterium]|nr:DUF4476 domain-containing protein [Chitinophagales bacterium]